MGCAMGLVALGVGYLVFLNANREKEGLKLLGQALGVFIMIVAVLSLLCSAAKCMKGGYSKAPMCPLTAKAVDAS